MWKVWHEGQPREGRGLLLEEGDAFFGEAGQDGEEEEREGIRMSNVCGRVRTV